MQGSARIDELRQKFHENPRRYFAPLANEYRKAGDPEQAIAICRAHLAQQPGHMSGHVVYGQALYDAQRIDEARTVFEKALSLDPDNATVLRQLGDIARQRGETAEAKHWYSRALDANPHDPEVAAYIAELTEPVTETEPIEARAPEVQVEDAEPAESQAPESPVEELEAATAESEIADADIGEPLSAEEQPIAVTDAESPAEPTDTEETAHSEEEPAEIKLDIPVVPVSDVSWRKTPSHEDSPFVTRTMAELYAKQGYRAAALDVYRQLALIHPADAEILARIEELAGEPNRFAHVAEPGDAARGPEEPSMEIEHPVADSAEPQPSQVETIDLAQENLQAEETATPVVEEPAALEFERASLDWPDLMDDIIYVPSSEDSTPEPEPIAPVTDGPHFTEMEITNGDNWDTDTWGAGFSSEEVTDVDIEAPDTFSESSAPETPSLSEEASAPATEAAEPAAEAAAPVAAEDEAPAAAESEAAGEPDEAHLVAYSPQAPDDEDLPHFTPKGPTIREFFATLGARKPSSRDSAQTFTARADVPSIDPATDQPLAASAFADLFPDTPVSEEDSRAAFALSGAMTSSPHTTPALDNEPRTPPAPAPPESAQESDEDIRRFREWLDGLAES